MGRIITFRQAKRNEEEIKYKRAAAIISIEDPHNHEPRILLAQRNKEGEYEQYLPGGKFEPEKGDKDCRHTLVRELDDELNLIVRVKDLEPYYVFDSYPSFRQYTYWVRSLSGDIANLQLSKELRNPRWVGGTDFYNTSIFYKEATRAIIMQLIRDGFLYVPLDLVDQTCTQKKEPDLTEKLTQISNAA